MNRFVHDGADPRLNISRFLDEVGPKPSDVFVIELAYIDHRNGPEHIRPAHIADATELLAALSDRIDAPPIPVAFVNDLSGAPVCGLESCVADQPGHDIVHGTITNVCGYDAMVFGMRNAKSRAIKSLKKAIRRGMTDGVGVFVISEEREIASSIWASTLDEEVQLAIRDETTGKIIPRCAAIMAQHYLDLGKHARSIIPGDGRVVIVDFNHSLERYRVRLGAAVSFSVFEWDNDWDVLVANVSYQYSRDDAVLDLTAGPH